MLKVHEAIERWNAEKRRENPYRKWTSKKAAVLAAFKKCASVTRACEIADIARATFYGWLKDDPEFKAAYEAAREEAVEVLEEEAIRRATIGGSDTLLIFLLKGMRPDKYRENRAVQVSGPGGGAITTHKVIVKMVDVPNHHQDPGDRL